jgi:hypothetical protein
MEKLWSKFTAEQIVSILLIVPLPFILVWTAIASHFLVGRLEAIFLGSQLLQQDRRFIKNLGLFGSVVICGSVFLLCLIPEFSVRRGLAVQKEIENMPQHLKFLLYPPFTALYVWLAALLLAGLVFGWR